MSFNLVDLVKDQLTGQVKGHVSKMLGNESGKADAALGAAVPGLLKGLAQSASTAGGADSLLKAINSQDDAMVNNIGSVLGGDKAGALLESGNKSLSSLFGDKGVGALIGAVSGSSGLSKGGTKSIMGLAAPMVMGALKSKVKEGGLNASSLASMLKDQGSNIDKAMPAGLSQQLSSQGFLSSISGGASTAANTAKKTAANTASNFGGGNGPEGTPIWKKILPIAGVLALIWIGINLFSGKEAPKVTDVTDAVGDKVADGAAAVGDVAAEGVAAVEGVVAEGADMVADGAAAVTDVAAEGVAAVEGVVAEGADMVADGAAAVTDVAADGVAAVEGVVAEGTDMVADGAAAVTDVAADGVAAVADGAEAAVDTATDVVAEGADVVAEGADAVTDVAADGVEAVADGAEAAVETATDVVVEGADVVEGAVQGEVAVEEVAVEEAATDEMATDTDAVVEEVAEDTAIDRSSFSLGAISRSFGGIFGTAGALLGGVSDADSATAALPQLEALAGNLDGVADQYMAVPEAARGPLAKVVSNGVAKLTPLADTVLNKEGVGDVLGGVMGPMMDKLKGLTQ